ncbi:MAG TPA: AMP-binding protein [Pseudonocardia sp.]|nr:AMP-binding protein [Pseudonocardia sp.]
MTEPGVHAGGAFTSLADIRERAARFASALTRLGVGRGDSVAVMMPNRVEFFEIALGVRAAGATLVPVSRQLTAGEVAYILEDCDAALTVVSDDLADIARDAAPARTRVVVGRSGPDTADYDDLVAAAEPWSAGQEQSPAEPMLYTSGTTGRPKGVRKSASTPEQTAAMGRWITELFGLERGMRTIVANPLYHSAGYGHAMLVLRQRGLVVLEERFDPERFLALIERHRITHLQLVPTMMYRLLRLPARTRDRYDVSSLRHVLHGAGPCAPQTKRALIDWWGPVVREYYGSTETGGLVSCSSAEWLDHPGTVGKARDGAIVRVVDEQGRSLPAGEVGTVYAHHPSTPPFTYHRAGDKRAQIELDGLVTCGDLGYLDDEGYLYLVDRRTDLVLCGGVNLYPAEIEQQLQQMPGVADCAVVGGPDPELGQIPVAFVLPQDGARPTLDDVRGFLAGRLSRQKHPRRLELVDQLPRDDTGKVRRQRLLELTATALDSARAPGTVG